MNPLRRWLNRPATNELCNQAIRLHRALNHHHQPAAIPGYTPTPGDTYETTVYGRLVGIRMAICTLNGWDPHRDSGTDGPADRLIIAHWERLAAPQPQDHNPRRT